MRLLTALGNQNIQDNLRESYPDLELLMQDIFYQEGVLEALHQFSPDAILLSTEIEGEMDSKDFIEAVRSINQTVKIILIVKDQNNELSNWLILKGIFDVFLDGQCTFKDIYDALIREQKVIVKTEIQNEYIQKEKVITKEKIIKEIVPVSFRKLILSIWGSSEFGCELAYFIARLTDKSAMLIDFDTVSPKTDIYLSISKAFEIHYLC